MGELDYKESWSPKNWCFWTVVLENTLEKVPWTARRSNQSIQKEISPEYSLEKTAAEAEIPILWPPDGKNWLIWKDPDAEKDWRQEEKGMTEDKTVRWHHWLNGHEFEQARGVGDGQVGYNWATELNSTLFCTYTLMSSKVFIVFYASPCLCLLSDSP